MRPKGCKIERKVGLCLLMMIVSQYLIAQKILSEGTLRYEIKAWPMAGNELLARAFDGATQTVYLRGNLCRVDFNSSIRNQSTFLNSSTGEATIIRETGSEKYQWNLTAAQWKIFQNSWNTTGWEVLPAKSEKAGYICQIAHTQTLSGDSVLVYFTKQLDPLIKGFEPLTAGLEGLAIEYEIKTKELTISYTLVLLQNIPVGASRFLIPEAGYKILVFPEKNGTLRITD